MDAWEELTPREYDAVWDRFYQQFAFRPSVHHEHWPSIKEPPSSLTYDISSALGRGAAHYDAMEHDLVSKVLAALRRCVPSAGRIYALDWQHACYWFRPHAPFAADDPAAWFVPILPNGDYAIFLAEDFRFGLFGHPWEQTICVFGQPLVQAIAEEKPHLFSRAVRQDGWLCDDAG